MNVAVAARASIARRAGSSALLPGCPRGFSTSTSAKMVAAQEIPVLDPTTYANYTEIASEHIALEWSVDWESKVITGSATHTLRAKSDGVKEAL